MSIRRGQQLEHTEGAATWVQQHENTEGAAGETVELGCWNIFLSPFFSLIHFFVRYIWGGGGGWWFGGGVGRG